MMMTLLGGLSLAHPTHPADPEQHAMKHLQNSLPMWNGLIPDHVVVVVLMMMKHLQNSLPMWNGMREERVTVVLMMIRSKLLRIC